MAGELRTAQRITFFIMRILRTDRPRISRAAFRAPLSFFPESLPIRCRMDVYEPSSADEAEEDDSAAASATEGVGSSASRSSTFSPS
ncbi:MAG TPA: hypothetical protein DCQ98_14105 [Planctomycetaceae bacterium]|nr:hypothetical protein [Planctomycetaceae bacterium]